METASPNYHLEFAKSPHHLWLGIVTFYFGLATASWLGIILAFAGYVIGWIYLPDLGLFRRWVDRRNEEAQRKLELAKVAEFVRKRDAILGSLSTERYTRYLTLSEVCRSIENTGAGLALEANPRAMRLDELMWTYLRLLTIEESLERFLQIEESEQVPMLVREAEHEIDTLRAEIETLEPKTCAGELEAKQRYLTSRLERLEVLHKRCARTLQGRDNFALIHAEQERLEQQIKLIRADAVAAKNAGALSARIDATVTQLEETNKWLAELDDYHELATSLPETSLRVGFAGSAAN